MKTSVIEVHDMLSVLSVDEVEKRIGEVPGVESVTVNYAAGSATVRYDETRLEVADIKSSVRQRGSAAGDESHAAPGAPTAPQTPPGPKTTPVATATPPPTTPKPPPVPPEAAPPGHDQHTKDKS